MKAAPLLNERHQLAANAFVELRVWRVPNQVPGSSHHLKYAFAYVVAGVCVVRYDNEAGKGDHRHIGDVQSSYPFTSAAALMKDFWKDVEEWRSK